MASEHRIWYLPRARCSATSPCFIASSEASPSVCVCRMRGRWSGGGLADEAGRTSSLCALRAGAEEACRPHAEKREHRAPFALVGSLATAGGSSPLYGQGQRSEARGGATDGPAFATDVVPRNGRGAHGGWARASSTTTMVSSCNRARTAASPPGVRAALGGASYSVAKLGRWIVGVGSTMASRLEDLEPPAPLGRWLSQPRPLSTTSAARLQKRNTHTHTRALRATPVGPHERRPCLGTMLKVPAQRHHASNIPPVTLMPLACVGAGGGFWRSRGVQAFGSWGDGIGTGIYNGPCRNLLISLIVRFSGPGGLVCDRTCRVETSAAVWLHFSASVLNVQPGLPAPRRRDGRIGAGGLLGGGGGSSESHDPRMVLGQRVMFEDIGPVQHRQSSG